LIRVNKRHTVHKLIYRACATYLIIVIDVVHLSMITSIWRGYMSHTFSIIWYG